MRSRPAYFYLTRMLLLVLVLVLVWQVSQMWHRLEYPSPGTNDFIAYWSAGQLLLQGKNPYDSDALYRIQLSLGSKVDSPVTMWNPPWLLIWILPLLYLPFKAAALVWLLLNLALVLACGSLVWRLLTPAPASRRIAAAWIASVAFIPALFTIRMGQVSTLLLVGVVGFLFGVEKDKPLLAGVFLALTTVKPHVLYLLWIAAGWWVLSERRWRLIAGACVAMLVSLAALTAVWPTWVTAYLRVVVNPPLDWASATIGSVLRLLFFRNWPTAQYLPTILTGLAFLAYLLAARPRLNWRKAISPLLLLSVSTAAYGWTFDQVVLLVPYLEIVSRLLGDELRMKRLQKGLIVAGLLCIGAVMVLENYLRINEVFFFWAPWALAAVYGYSDAVQR